MILNPWTFLFEILNFAVLVFVLRRLLYTPLREAIDRRKAENDQMRLEAEAARNEAGNLKVEVEARKAELDRTRQEVIAAARAEGEADRAAILAEADQAARRRHEELERTLDSVRGDALLALRAELIKSTIALAERLLRESADSSLDGELDRAFLDTLDRLSDEERACLRRDWESGETAIVETTRPLDAAALERFRAVVARLVGEPVPLDFRTRPELLGGVRLSLAGHVWDATLSGQLDEIRPSITPGGP
jgi:F-type H+-transporting ATPase subunit b